MAKKGQNIIPLDEDQYTSVEVNEFSSGDCFTDGFNEDISDVPITSDEALIKVFSFNSDSENNGSNTDMKIESINNINTFPNDNKLSNNKTPSINPSILDATPTQKIRGLTPKINGEAFDIKRCYQFRASTLKKLNQLKGESDNINIYLNEIIDEAICYYHNSVFNNK